MTPSPTHDSEDWLDQLFFEMDFEHLIHDEPGGDNFCETCQADADRLCFSQNRNLETFKQTILAHFAHYLKPEDVEREQVNLLKRIEPSRQNEIYKRFDYMDQKPLEEICAAYKESIERVIGDGEVHVSHVCPTDSIPCREFHARGNLRNDQHKRAELESSEITKGELES